MDSHTILKNKARVAKDLGEERARTRAGFSGGAPHTAKDVTTEKKKGEASGKTAKPKGKENVNPEAAKQAAAKQKSMEKARLEAEKLKAEAQKAQQDREAAARKKIEDLEAEARKAQTNLDRVRRAAEAARRAAEGERAQMGHRQAPFSDTPSYTGQPDRPPPQEQQEEPMQVSWQNQDYIPQPEGMSREDMKTKRIADNIRKLHPNMADYSDEFLAAQSVADLQRAKRDSNNAELAKPAKRIEMRHQANYARAKANPSIIPEGLDNRSTILHEARFLPGAATRGTDLWLRAREVWGEQGVDPICNYDVSGMGMAGCITARGIEALHNPGSDEISIKLFTVSNVIHAKSGTRTIQAAGEDRFESIESWKEVNDINELKTAFRNMRKAAFMIRPWDYSFEVLEAWITPTFWLAEELKGYNKASLTGEFIDHILVLNAAHWIQELPYLSISDIQIQWTSWWATRKSCAPRSFPEEGGDHKQREKKPHNPKGGQKNGGSRGGGRGGLFSRGGKRQDGRNMYMPPFINPATEANTCIFYNKDTGCRNTAQSCVQTVKG